MPECPQRPVSEIAHICLMLICFPLERNVKIGEIMFFVLDQADQILGKIPNIKDNQAQFKLLP